MHPGEPSRRLPWRVLQALVAACALWAGVNAFGPVPLPGGCRGEVVAWWSAGLFAVLSTVLGPPERRGASAWLLTVSLAGLWVLIGLARLRMGCSFGP